MGSQQEQSTSVLWSNSHDDSAPSPSAAGVQHVAGGPACLPRSGSRFRLVLQGIK
jgi:hypothetical protein